MRRGSKESHHPSWQKGASLAVTLAMVATLQVGRLADAEIATFPDGTELEVTIDSPADGSSPVDGQADLVGTARVGAGDTPADTSLVVVYDLSGSTLDPAGGDCGGDVNGDGRSNTILDCEIAAMEVLEQTAEALGSVAEMGVTLFELGSAAADVQPASGVQRLTVPGADLNANGVTDIAEVVRSSRWTSGWFSADATVSLFTRFDAGTGNGGTNYSAGLSSACQTLAATSQPNRTIVFLSDGGANRGSDVTTVLPCSQPATVHTVAVGAGSTCASDPSGLGSLQEVADLTGGTCTEVISPEDLPDIIGGIISPEIYLLGLSVNGGPEIDISGTTSAPLPAKGPDPLDWAYTVENLLGPEDEICVTAYARRDTELVEATECITLISDRPPIADAGPDQTVAEGSLVQLDGSASYDPDDDPLSYRWEITSQTGAPIVLSSTTEPIAAFIAFDDGTYDIRLTVSDGRTEVSDTTRVTVENVAPVADALAEPAAEGGVALITASFTDPGILDTHTATIDWGDGDAVEPVAISAQGNGWGSMFASHVYGGPGSFVATITVTDDDGGVDVVESVSVEVGASLAIWANSETAKRTIDWSGGTGVVEGLVHSNNEIRANGASKTFDGPVEHVGAITIGSQVELTEPATQVAPSGFPVIFDIADYRPGGRAAIDAGSTYFDMSAECGKRWDPPGPLAAGLYYVPCDVKLNSGALAGAVTIAAEGDVQVSGNGADFEPYVDGLLFLSTSPGNKAVQISSSGSTFFGYLFAETGRVDLSGAENTYLCGILADRVDVSDSKLSIRASDCVRPERTVAPPSLVPDLDLTVDVSPADVLPGDVADATTTVTNTGALLLVPGVVGLENLGTADVTVTGVDIGIEYRPVGGTWTALAETPSLSVTPNPAPGVTYPSSEPVIGTVIAPDGLATWGAELQVFLPAATVDFLLDPAQVAAVRNSVEFTLFNPTGEPVRRLFRFGNDFADELRALGGDLTDVRIVATATDGTTAIVDSAAEPALAVLGPGSSASTTRSATVAVPLPRGVIEPTGSYRSRLGALDETELVGSAFALSTGGVGTVLGPFAFDSTERHVPIAGVDLSGPLLLVAGDTANYDIELRNTGSAEAVAVATELEVDGAALSVVGLPTSLAPGVISSTAFAYDVPPDRPVGLLDADVSTTWEDQNGNIYGDVRDTVTTEIGSPPDLSALLADALLVDADGSGLPSPGDTIRYSATVTNQGTTPADGVVFSAPVDPASVLVPGAVVTSVGTVLEGNTAGDTTVIVDVGTIAPMTSVEITFDVVIPDPVPGGATQLSVQGLVTSDDLPDVLTDDPGESGLSDPTVTRIVDTPPSLQAILAGRLAVDADGDGFIGPADTVEYALQLTNSGLTAATGVVASVEPDANTAVVVGSVVADGATIVEGNTAGDTRVVVDFSSVPGLSQVMVTYQVVVADPLPAGTTQIVAQGLVESDQLADVLSDDPTLPGTDDPTVLFVVTSTGSPGGPGGGGGGPVSAIGDVSPPDGEVVTTPIDIGASITPPDGTTVVGWRVVAYRAGGDPLAGIELASGVGDPPATLATFDPTVVSNGTWVLRVEVTDSGGGVGTSESSVVVEGNLKLGRYAVTYQDASVSVAGIPMRVQRTYDTLDRSSTADFGYGWSLDVANFEVSTNRPLGEGPWTAESCGPGLIFVPLCFSTATPRLVNVTWPDGRVESFELKPTGNTFFSIFMTAEYEPRPRATSKLRAAPGDEVGGLGGDGNMRDGGFGFGDVYNPQRFVLVGADGTEYLLDRDVGLVKATDRYGNTVTYSDAGITSSLGPSLTFTRDAQGRIVTLTEPTGSTVDYTYDAAGDLVSVVDQSGNETTFTYDTGHYLVVIDDAGPGPFRTMNYGPDGRLESTTDAEGNTTAVSFDVDARRQVVTAPDGRSTKITTFDERGNATVVDDVYDGVSHVTTLTYDANDKVTSRTDPNGDTWSSTWDDNGNMTSYTDANGARTSYAYGAFDLPVAITDAAGAVRTFEYDSVGNLVAIIHPAGATFGFARATPVAGGTETFTYDAAGNLLTRTDALGHAWTWQYDGNGNITRVTDPLGNEINYTYDASGRMLTETDGVGAVTSYTYDAIGNLLTHTDPLGNTTQWQYDARDQVVAVTDPLGHQTTYAYDDTGALISVVDPTSRTWNYQYAFGRTVTATAPDGGITQFAYNAAGRLERATDEVGNTYEYGYDAAGRWISTDYPFGDGQRGTIENLLDANGASVGETDGLGATWTYERDSLSRIVEVVNPVGSTSRTDYDILGRRIRSIDGAGNTTRYAYDAAGQLTSLTAPDGGVTTYEYDAAGNRVAITDPLGRRTTAAFDAAYRAVSWTDPAGNVASSVYDLAGRVTSTSTFAGVTTDIAYDARSMVSAFSDGLGNTTTLAYDAAGRTATRTDAKGNVTTFGYDAAGRPETTTDALGGVLAMEYDLADQLTAVVDPDGNRRVFAYDDAGLIAAQTDPLGRMWRFDYDAIGQVASMLDPRGELVEYDYDLAGRLVAETSSSGVVSHGYDVAGRRTSMIDPTGTTTFRYDDVGRLTAVESAAGDLGYAYNLAGEQIAMLQPQGAVSYEYDALGHLERLTDWTGAAVDLTSDPDGRLGTVSRPNGVQSAYSYDAAGRLTAIAHDDGAGVVASYDYLLDANGNRDRMTVATGGGTRVEQYTYDALNRLVDVDYGDGVAETFAYDATGNRTQRAITGGPAAGTTSYTYDSAQQLTSVTGPAGSRTLQYDAAGYLLDDGQGGTFGWDERGRMVTADVGTTSQSYGYDGDGLRVDVDGVAQLWDRTAGLPQLVSDGSSGYVHLGGQVMSEISAAGTGWLLGDALGSVRTITDGAGAVTTTAQYDAYGAVRAQTGVASTFGFTGQQTDATGLTYLRARSYDSSVGRFLSPDTVQPNAPGTQGWNLYGYANANPTTFIDPSGHTALVEYASLVRNSVITQTAIRLLGLCIKGILEGIAFELVLADIFGYEYQFEWEWALVDCAIEIIFAGFGPPSPPRPRPPRPDPPHPRPDPPRPHGPDSPPRGRPPGPDGPNGPRGPEGPNRPRDPEGPNRPRDPNTPCSSFTAETHVLLADGTTLPIGEIESGDVVWAMDPTTGDAGPRLVSDVLVHVDDDELVEIDIDGATITATDHHPFWNVRAHGWVAADELAPGDVLLTPDGTTVAVDSTLTTAGEATTVFNLTVEDLHTFFVVAADEPVLVHNAGGPGCPTSAGGPGKWGPAGEGGAKPRAVKYESQITGAPPNTAYRVNGVKFDGYSNGVLQEAKGPGYSNFVKDGQFQPFFDGADDMIGQAQRQLAAANGTPIKWSVAESDAATAIRNLFEQNGITGIDVVHVPAG